MNQIVNYEIKTIENEMELNSVLEFCYHLLGQHMRYIENYTYEAWKNRINDWSKLLVFAEVDDKIISAVLGRLENNDSLILGFTACNERYRNRGITKSLINVFESNAKKLGFKFITLGADPSSNGFYEKCGYIEINEMHGQKIYQKIL